MNKIWMVIAVIVLLVGGVATLGGFYWQKNEELKDAESQIVTMGLNFSTLEKVRSGQEEIITILQADLTAAQAEILKLEGDLEDAEDEISRLEGELAEAQ